MASVYEFDNSATLKNANYPKSGPVVAEIQKALTKANIPKTQVDKFVTDLKAFNFGPIAATANAYISKNMVAKGLAPVTANPNALQKAMMVALYGPQKKILLASFDLSVHVKAGNVELQHTDCKGAKKILLTATP